MEGLEETRMREHLHFQGFQRVYGRACTPKLKHPLQSPACHGTLQNTTESR